MKTLHSLLISLAALAVGTASAQTISVTASSLSFSGQAGGASISQTMTVLSSGGNTSVALIPSQTWLTVSPSLGVTPLQVTVTANPAGLTAGTYQDTKFQVEGGNPESIVLVPVTFTVSSIAVAPASLSFAYAANSSLFPASQNLTLSGQSGATFTVAATTATGGNWLEPALVSGALPTNTALSIFMNQTVIQSLATGTYQGTVTISPSGSPAISVPVTLTVSTEPPVTITPSTVNLNYQIGGLNNQGSQEAVTLATTSTAALSYSFGTPSVSPNPEGCNWISVNPTSGTIPADSSAQAIISYNCPTALPAGSYPGSVVVSVPGATPATTTLPVNLNVSTTPLLIVPTGALSFTYELGTNPPAAQTVTPQSTAVTAISPVGQMAITATAATTSGGAWLSVSPTVNLTTGMPISVSVSPSSLLPGTYMGTVTVAPAVGATAGNGAQTIQVYKRVRAR